MIDQTTEVMFNRKVARETFLLGLRSPEIVSKSRPGQFVMIRVRTGMDPLLRRPFSICGTGEDGRVLILYRVVGRGTAILAGTGKGDRLHVLGPLGKGFDMAENRKNLLVGGGIGIAPLLYLGRRLAQENLDFQFMAGFGTAEDIISLEDIMPVGFEWALATDDGTKGYHGFVTDLLKGALDGSGPGPEALSVAACGPLSMLKKAADLSRECGIPCQVSLEANMACGLGACLGCAVPATRGGQGSYLHVCKDGPVFSAESISWKE